MACQHSRCPKLAQRSFDEKDQGCRANPNGSKKTGGNLCALPSSQLEHRRVARRIPFTLGELRSGARRRDATLIPRLRTHEATVNYKE